MKKNRNKENEKLRREHKQVFMEAPPVDVPRAQGYGEFLCTSSSDLHSSLPYLFSFPPSSSIFTLGCFASDCFVPMFMSFVGPFVLFCFVLRMFNVTMDLSDCFLDLSCLVSFLECLCRYSSVRFWE